MTSANKLFVMTIMILALGVTGASSTYDGIFTVKDFKTGGDNYVIVGKKATINSNRVTIDRIRARIFQEKGDLYLFSPKCNFNQDQKMGYSDETVHIRNKNMTIDGIGFELDLGHGKIFVRKDVRVKIYNYREDLLGH